MRVAPIYTWTPTAHIYSFKHGHTTHTNFDTDNDRNYGQKTTRIPNVKSTIVGMILS